MVDFIALFLWHLGSGKAEEHFLGDNFGEIRLNGKNANVEHLLNLNADGMNLPPLM